MAPRAKKWLKLLEDFVAELRIKSREIVAEDRMVSAIMDDGK
jgi:hypothetical protein